MVGDFNGDGKADLAVVGGNSQMTDVVSIFQGNGDGTFSGPVSFAAGQGPGYIVAGDFNGDDKPDLAVTNNGNFFTNSPREVYDRN